jgi:hypothetical protein
LDGFGRCCGNKQKENHRKNKEKVGYAVLLNNKEKAIFTKLDLQSPIINIICSTTKCNQKRVIITDSLSTMTEKDPKNQNPNKTDHRP